jgi:Protein of unknown function (DUF3050)
LGSAGFRYAKLRLNGIESMGAQFPDNRVVTTLDAIPSFSSQDRSTSEALEALAVRIAPLRAQLENHPLYARIWTAEDLRVFMESHVFAVWDFMSLLKALQRRLTCVAVPWRPTEWPESRRFINEIVLGEESDVFKGRAVSHFELYLEAMQEAGADVEPISRLLERLAAGDLDLDRVPEAAGRFMRATFGLIDSGGVHELAAAFTFGREDLIPDMFRSLVRDLNAKLGGRFGKFQWYLERHIEVDGEDHGPLSLRMVADLCGTDARRWEEAAMAAEEALLARIALWDGILKAI